MIHLFHNWSKWTQFEQQMERRFLETDKTINYVESWQRRNCKICGYTQERKVNNC